MPIYTYHCITCGKEAEYLVPKEELRCFNCNGLGLERVAGVDTFSVKDSRKSRPNANTPDVLKGSVVLGNLACSCGGHYSVHALPPNND